MLLLLQVLFFGLTLWLGLYLLHRNWREPRLLWTGLGLVSYAIGMGAMIVHINSVTASDFTPPDFTTLSVFPSSAYWWLLSLPALLWTGAAIHLLPDTEDIPDQTSEYDIKTLQPDQTTLLKTIPWRVHLIRFWLYGQLPIVGLLAPLFLVTGMNNATEVTQILQIILALTLSLPLGFVLLLVAYQAYSTPPESSTRNGPQIRYALGLGTFLNASHLVVVATFFFGLSTSMLLLPFTSTNPSGLILSIGADLMLLGFVIGWWDAFDQGEMFKIDLLLSLDGALIYSIIFGSMVAVVMNVSTGTTAPMLTLLLLTIAAAITMQMYAGVIQTALDNVVFSHLPQVREERATLRAVADAVPKRPQLAKLDAELDEKKAESSQKAPNSLFSNEDELIRVTRRSLSALGDMGKLAISPLMQLDIINQRLAEHSAGNPIHANTLERAQVLQTVLFHAIEQLHPADGAKFGTTGQWRYYNALYYPYVLGLKPYSRRARYDDLDEDVQQALDWFRTYVPERTLYNWQTAGAKLVAKYLSEVEGEANKP